MIPSTLIFACLTGFEVVGFKMLKPVLLGALAQQTRSVSRTLDICYLLGSSKSKYPPHIGFLSMCAMGIGVFNKGDGCSAFPNVLPLEPFILGTWQGWLLWRTCFRMSWPAASPCLLQTALTSTLRLNRSWGFQLLFQKDIGYLIRNKLWRACQGVPVPATSQSQTQELPKWGIFLVYFPMCAPKTTAVLKTMQAQWRGWLKVVISEMD